MFIRFERIQRPQSYNDNPITSLSWMTNDLNNRNTGGGGGGRENGLNGSITTGSVGQDNQQRHQQHCHHPVGVDDSTIRDINNNNNNSNNNISGNGVENNPSDLQESSSSISSVDNHHHHHRHNSLSFPNRSKGHTNNKKRNPDDSNEDILDGWLAVGNCRGIVGISYTTIDSSHIQSFKQEKLFATTQVMTTDDNGDYGENQNFHQHSHPPQHQNVFSFSLSSSVPQRTNFNLRGHRSEIVFVRWNEPYQKLASCDRNGVIFVWIKYEGRWSIELINDRNTRVTDFAWSHDGRMALICYMDGFVLVGSVSGQRYWSSMLNLNECSITCGTWTANNQHVLFGTSNGHILVISVHGVFITQISVQEGVEINGMMWSCRKFSTRLMEDQQLNRNNNDGTSTSSMKQDEYESLDNKTQQHMLAVSFVDGTIYLMRNYDEVFPNVIETSLLNVKMEWSSNGEMLAIGGHRITKSSNGTYIYNNVVRFHSANGMLIKQVQLDYNWQPLSALTWACNDRRVFIACGQLLYVAWIINRIPSLSFISGLQVYNSLKEESDITRLQVPEPVKNLLSELFASTIHCYLPDYSNICRFVFRPPVNNIRLHCTLMRHESDMAQPSADTTYILYLEYLGGLVPILKGKRSSKLKPEFVIFDPQLRSPTGIRASTPSSENNISSARIMDNGGKRFRYFMNNPSNNNQSSGNNSGWNTSTTAPHTSESENEDNSSSSSSSFVGGPSYLTAKTRRRLRCRSAQLSRLNRHNIEQFVQQQFHHSHGYPHIQNHHTHHTTLAPWNNDLPEHEKIVLITSNIWGTKFKFLGITPMLPTHLGSVTYRTSLLHLQPRQMSLVIKELNERNTLNNGQHQQQDTSMYMQRFGNDDYYYGHNGIRRGYPYSSDSEDEFSEQQMDIINNSSGQMPPIVPINPFKSVRNSMLLSLNNIPQQININGEQQQQPIVDNIASSSTNIMPPSDEQSQINSNSNNFAMATDEFLTLQIQQNDSGGTMSYNVEIKPSPSSSMMIMGTSNNQQKTTMNNHIAHHHHHVHNNKNINSRHPIMENNNSSPAANVNTITTMVRQFKHQTFQSESPKHVSSYYRSAGCGQQQINHHHQQSSSSPKLYSSPNISPNKQIIRSKILKESPRKSSVSYCSNEFTKKSYVAINETAMVCDIGANESLDHHHLSSTKSPSKTYLVKYKTCSNEAYATTVGGKNIGGDRWITTANSSTISSDGHGGNGHLYNQHQATTTATPFQSYQTYHIYDDTYLLSSPVTTTNKQKSEITSDTTTPISKNDKAQQQPGTSNSKLFSSNTNLDDDDDDINSSESYFRNVEQVMQSLSQKLSLNQNLVPNDLEQDYIHLHDEIDKYKSQNGSNILFRSNSLTYGYESNLASLQSQTPTKKPFMVSNKLTNFGSSRDSSSYQITRRNLSINSLISDIDQLDSGTAQSSQNERFYSTKTNTKGNHNHRSLPASPLMNNNRKDYYHHPTSKQQQQLQQPRKSNGRHFFQSPKVVRKLRQKLSYLDCSSEDENNTSDDDLEELDTRNHQHFYRQHNHESTSAILINDKINKKTLRNNNNQHKQAYYRRYSSSKYDMDKESKRFVLHNKAPLWNEVSQVYQLDFGGRVTQESAKNFQIEYQGRQVMQFGRIDTNAYTLDFEYPFSAVQAMAVALANVTQRLK